MPNTLAISIVRLHDEPDIFLKFSLCFMEHSKLMIKRADDKSHAA